MTNLIRTAVALGLLVIGLPSLAAAQGPPATGVASPAPGEAKTMTDVQRAKLDAFLKQAVADKRQELLNVMIRLGVKEGADARVGEVLEKLGLKASRTISSGRIVVVALKAEQLVDIVASTDVERVSFDAFVTPQKK
jgi:hypothetical protein